MDTNGILQVTNIEKLHSDVANCDFKKVTFTARRVFNGRLLKTNKSGTRNLWPAHEMEVEGKLVQFKGDTDYDDIMIGDEFEGSIQSFDTTPYEIEPGRKIEKYTCVVLGTEVGIEVAARNLVKNDAHVFLGPKEDRKFFQIKTLAPIKAKVLTGEPDDNDKP